MVLIEVYMIPHTDKQTATLILKESQHDLEITNRYLDFRWLIFLNHNTNHYKY